MKLGAKGSKIKLPKITRARARLTKIKRTVWAVRYRLLVGFEFDHQK
jgi:hypothetical protein